MPGHGRTSSISAVSLASSGDGDTASFRTPEHGASPELAWDSELQHAHDDAVEQFTPPGRTASSRDPGLRIDVASSSSWLSSSPSTGIGLGIDLTGSGARTPTATTPLADPDPGSPSSWPSSSSGARTPKRQPSTPSTRKRSFSPRSSSPRMAVAEDDPLSARSARSQDPLLRQSLSSSRTSDDLDRQLDALGIYDAELGLDQQQRVALVRHSADQTKSDFDLESLSEWSEDEEEHFLGESSEDDLSTAVEGDDWDPPTQSHNGIGGRPPSPVGGQRKKRRRKGASKLSAGQRDPSGLRAGSISLMEVVSPLVQAHPLALLPLLPLLPHAFLPAGIAFFIPALVIVAGLSVCSSVVLLYIARYLKAPSFEDISGQIAGEKGLWAGRALQVLGAMGVVVGWLSSVHPIIEPVLRSVFPEGSWLQSHILWTLIASLPLMPTLIPIRHNYTALARLPQCGVLLFPLVIFLVIGRTVEVSKEMLPTLGSDTNPDGSGVTRALLLEGTEPITTEMRAGTALMLLMLLFTPHSHVLPIQTSVIRDSRAKFPFVSLGVAATIVLLILPFSLVPYYLLESSKSPAPPFGTHRAGVFEVLARATDATDGWANFARVSMITLLLQSASAWTTRAREICLRALGVEREGRLKASRWVGMAMWGFISGFAVVGGWLAAKVEMTGIGLTLAVGWLLPATYFIKVFHISSPLAIVFPSSSQSAPGSTVSQALGTPGSHSADALLARKERELQRKRLTRRLWQDLIVLVGILPLGGFAVVWSVMMLFGAV